MLRFSPCPRPCSCQAALELSTRLESATTTWTQSFVPGCLRNTHCVRQHKPGQPLARESRAAASRGHLARPLIHYITNALCFSAVPFPPSFNKLCHTEEIPWLVAECSDVINWLKTLKINETDKSKVSHIKQTGASPVFCLCLAHELSFLLPVMSACS